MTSERRLNLKLSARSSKVAILLWSLRSGLLASFLGCSIAIAPAAHAGSTKNLSDVIAASPQRELKSDWDLCFAQLLVINGDTISVEQFERVGFLYCSSYESAFTGALVRQIGVTRANAYIQEYKAAVVDLVSKKVAARSRTAPGQLEKTADGWIIENNPVDGCRALVYNKGMFGATYTMLLHYRNQDLIDFGNVGSNAKRQAQNFKGGTMTGPINVYTLGRSGEDIGQYDFYIGKFKTGFGFQIPFSNAFVQRLGPSSSVQFRFRDEVYTYQVEGLVNANVALDRCRKRFPRATP